MLEGAPVNVKDFGAVGDGVTDDTAAIQAAIDSFGASTSSSARGLVRLPKGTYKVTSSLYLPIEVSLVGDGGRTTKIVGDGDFEIIQWYSDIPTYSKGVKISGIWLSGSGVGSGNTNNTGIRLDHPFGMDHLTLEDIRLDGFAGYGIQTDQQGSGATTNCFQFSTWNNIRIENCGTGVLMGEGFCGESTINDLVITDCTTYGVEFGISATSVGAQGLTFNNLVIGRCPTGVYFGAGTSGMIVFNSGHFENLDSIGVHLNATNNKGLLFNGSWFVNTPTGFKCDAAATAATFDSCVWETTGAAGDEFVDINSGGPFVFEGHNQANGTLPTSQIEAYTFDIILGNVDRTSTTTGSFNDYKISKYYGQFRGLCGEDSLNEAANLTGRVAVGSGASSVNVSLGRTEADANYNVVATINFTTGTPTFFPGYSIGNKSTTGFTVYFSGATPAGGYVLDWILMRSI